MAYYTAEVLWVRGEQEFLDNRYSRRHVFRFDGGLEVPGSSSPHVIPLPMSDASAGARLPTKEQINEMHHEAHEECFIANSVKTDVRCEPVHVL